MSTAKIFSIAKMQNETRCPEADKCIKKMGCMPKGYQPKSLECMRNSGWES